MHGLDERATKRLKGEAWDKIRPELEAIHNALISVSPDARGELTTIYIKYTAPGSEKPYAVLWVKRSTDLVLGLALPEHYDTSQIPTIPPPLKYAGLTTFLKFTPGSEVPGVLKTWAQDAWLYSVASSSA